MANGNDRKPNMCLSFLFLFTLVRACKGSLNVYLNHYEVQRLLGLSKMQLYYVNDGVVNDYALNYIVRVPAAINSLHFTWESIVGRPLPYTIGVDVSNHIALAAPQLNISSNGLIPTTVQTFSVALPCSGMVTAEVNVVITINITLNRSTNNVMTLIFRRNKICLKNENQFNVESTQRVVSSVSSVSNSTNVFYIAAGFAFALVAVIAMFVPAYYVRTKKLRRQGEMMQESRNGSRNSGQAHTTFLSTDVPIPHNQFTGTSVSSCKSGASYASFRRLPSYSLIDDRSKDLHERIAELTIQRCRVRLCSVVLEGTFGRVYQGSYTDEDGIEENVIVKTVSDHASQVQISLLLQEGMTMYALNHKNILSVLGVSIEDHTAPFLIYPYHNYTNMKRFLQKCKLCPEGVAHTLTTQEVVDMALQIIQGMQYLHKKHLLHKDLAARNCVVDDKLRVQITDNALSRDLFPSDYHCLGDNENRPIKWLAIESLSDKTFSSSSDVWSFGVLLWELTTLGQQPFVEIDPFEMLAYLRDGYRLAQPINCPDELFAVMAYCWAMSSDERPTFSQLQVCLQEFFTQLTRYV